MRNRKQTLAALCLLCAVAASGGLLMMTAVAQTRAIRVINAATTPSGQSSTFAAPSGQAPRS
jgi:hypothetical protein